MKKTRQKLYSKALALLLTMITMVGIFTPMTTFATMEMEAEPIVTATTLPEMESNDALPSEEDAGETGDMDEAIDAMLPDDADIIDPESTPAAEMEENDPACPPKLDAQSSDIPETTSGIAPLTEWIVDEIWYYTKIHLTVRDQYHRPIPGVVYALYRLEDDSLVEYLTSNSDGIAVSGDVRSDTDYYLKEHSVPPGWVRNYTTMYIRLTQECDPTRLDLIVEYTCIEGIIKVVKTNEDGELLYGVGFHVYDVNTDAYMGMMRTDSNGECSIALPGGYYVLVEFNPLEGYVGDQEYYASITYDGEMNVLHIKNYFARGICRVLKVNTNEEGIEGAVFGLYTKYNVWIKDIVTGSGGSALIEDLLVGEYYLLEKSVPEPYLADTTTKHHFYVRYEGHWINLNIVNSVNGESAILTIHKTDERGNPLSGVVFGVYRKWDNLKLHELTTGMDGSVSTPQALVPGFYYISELVGKDGYERLTEIMLFTIDGNSTSHTITVVNPKIPVYGKVQIHKTDDAGNPLSGVRFGVYCDFGNLIEEITTVNGIATSSLLREGGYQIKELAGIPGYEFRNLTHFVTINSDFTLVPIEVMNPRIKGQVKVTKTGIDEETFLQGVVFGVYVAGTDALICELTTNEDGIALSDILYYGDYELRELSTVDGYELISSPIPFSIMEQGAVVSLHITNQLILGSVKITKIDSEVNGAGETPYLPGAVFGVYDDQEQKLTELTTDENGQAFYAGLLKGDYFLKELSAPNGYILNDALVPFSIDTHGAAVEMEITNTKGHGTLRLVKHGKDNVLLPEVSFEVYRESTDEMIGEIITDENGETEISLPLGCYYLKETQTAMGYVLPEGTVSFELSENEATVTVNMVNLMGNGTLHLLKSDEEGETLAGAVFDIYQEDDTFVTELSTALDGTAAQELPVGNYYLVEKIAPKNYILDSEPHPFTIEYGETCEVTMTNRAIVGTVEVYFRHWDDGREIVHMQSLTDKVGTDYVEWMQLNGYLDLLLEGYELVQTDFPESLTIIDGTLVVTLWYLEPEPVDGGTIPRTGDIPPYLNYALAFMLWSIAGYCGYVLFQERRLMGAGKQ